MSDTDPPTARLKRDALMVTMKIIGSLRQGDKTYEGALPEVHDIPPKRLQSFIDAGLLVPETAPVQAEIPASPARIGKWDLDPDGLKGLTLARLNSIVAERGGEEVFGIKENARVFLSQHFNPAATPKA